MVPSRSAGHFLRWKSYSFLQASPCSSSQEGIPLKAPTSETARKSFLSCRNRQSPAFPTCFRQRIVSKEKHTPPAFPGFHRRITALWPLSYQGACCVPMFRPRSPDQRFPLYPHSCNGLQVPYQTPAPYHGQRFRQFFSLPEAHSHPVSFCSFSALFFQRKLYISYLLLSCLFSGLGKLRKALVDAFPYILLFFVFDQIINIRVLHHLLRQSSANQLEIDKTFFDII